MAFFPTRWTKQPQGHCEIDWSHPLSRGLVFFAIPSQRTSPELVGGAALNSIAATPSFEAGPYGVGINSLSASSGGCSYAYRQDMFRTIGTDFTIATAVDLRVLSSNSKLVCVPMQSNTWNQPYQVMSLARSATGSQMGLYIGTTTSGAAQNALFPAGTVSVGNSSTYLATRSGTTAKLFLNSTKHTPSSATLTSSPIVFNTGGHVALLNRSAGMPGEGVDGVCYYAAFWSRALSDEEALSFNASPYQLLAPLQRKLYFDAFSTTLPAHNISGGLSLPKPSLSGAIEQEGIPAHSVSGGLSLPKPVASGTIAQGSIAPHEVSGGIALPKPTMAGFIAQGQIGAHTVSGGLSLPKPSIAGLIGQTFPARTITGGLRLNKPTLSGTIVQSPLAASVISGGLSLPKPRIRGLIGAPREYRFPVGVKLANGGQLSLATGHLLLMATDPEGNYEMVHPLAIPQRTVEAGFGATSLLFEGPLDPAELKYYTVRWDVELNGALDTIVPDDGTLEGQSVFLTLAGPAVAAGLQIHAMSQDEYSVTFWLKVDSTMQNRPQWAATGELHIITVRIITVRGQVFERDISFRVKQL